VAVEKERLVVVGTKDADAIVLVVGAGVVEVLDLFLKIALRL
jgi:hypothetical protein